MDATNQKINCTKNSSVPTSIKKAMYLKHTFLLPVDNFIDPFPFLLLVPAQGGTAVQRIIFCWL